MNPEIPDDWWNEIESAAEVSPSAVAADMDHAAEKVELAWVLAHPEISRSNHLVRFLSFICNKYFEGEMKDIREQMIATEALGRKLSNFDSHADPIVRVTAGRLRKKLEAIYRTDGCDRRLQIVLPVGHYVPQFVLREEGMAAVAVDDQPEADEPEIREEILHADEPAAKRFSRPAWLRRLWIPTLVVAASAGIFIGGFLVGQRQALPFHPAGDGIQWGDPVWTDEFNGVDHQLPDPAKWSYEVEDVNSPESKEHQVYCSPQGGGPRDCNPHRPNAFVDGMGHLVLRAQKNSNGVWTLARISTKGLKDFQYGRIEARIKMPVGRGLWPWFILVGANKDQVGWPASGSIDVAENVSTSELSNGLGPTMIRSTLHGPRYAGANGLWHDFRLPNGARIDDASFHTYGIIWSPGMVQFYVDDPSNVYMVHDASEVPEGGAWVFDHPFYLMLSLSEGGDWPGDSDRTTPNPADMLVDYVRVYQIPPVHVPTINWKSVQLTAGAATASTVLLRSQDYAGRVLLSCATDTPRVSCSLATTVLNFSDTLTQQDALMLSTSSYTENGRIVAPPGHYKLTLTATTISGDHSQLTVPFEVKAN